MAELAAADVILLGAVGAAPGATDVPSGLLERGLLLKLRFAFDHYVNLRPSRLFPGVPTPLAPSVTEGREIDFVVVREGTEGLYCGNGGVVRAGTPHEIATEVSVNTAYGVERVVRDAFARASRRRNKITLVHKHNVLVNAGGLWRRIFESVATEYPGVTTDYLHVDAATIFLATDPARFDVIVTDNLFGDILTDLAAAVTGGIGLAASGNINPDRTFPSMFEPVHGSAPDIAGKGIADPTATILSISLLLDHLGLTDEAARVEKAVIADISGRANGDQRSTTQIGDAIAGSV
jgi:3-isopropylmalate dehydrogenase